jgi:hypothetical protein
MVLFGVLMQVRGRVRVYKRRVVELLLEEVKLDVARAGRRRKGRHVLTACLVWPRPAIAEKLIAKTLEMEKLSVNLDSAGWIERILFKETVQGPFGVEISVTDRLSDSQVGEFLSFLGSAVLKLAGSEVGDLLAGGPASGLVEIPFKYLSKRVAAGPEGAAVLAGGSVDLVVDEKWKPGKAIRIEVPLAAPRAVYKTVRSSKHGEVTARRRKLLAAGQANGVAVINARVY